MAAASVAVILILALVLGNASLAAAQDTPWFSDEEYRMFRLFYHESFKPFFEIVGIDTLPDPLDEFERSLESFPPESCSAVVDFGIFRSTLIQAFFQPDNRKEVVNLLSLRVVFDLAGLPWVPVSALTPEEGAVAIEKRDFLVKYLRESEDRLLLVYTHCLDNHAGALGLVSVSRFTLNHAPAHIDIRMLRLFESLVPVTGWFLRTARESGRKEDLEELESLIDSMEQKYHLSVPGSRGTSPESSATASGHSHERQQAALSPPPGALGADATKAISQWPAAQEANPAWNWRRTLVFLTQAALVAQGHDPGELDGIMGPKTMLALLAWSAMGGPESSDHDLVDNVAYLLHTTLAETGLAPGAAGLLLGPRSTEVLKEWSHTFYIGGLIYPDDPDGAGVVVEAYFRKAAREAAAAEQRTQESAD